MSSQQLEGLRQRDRIGGSALRPDAPIKTSGEFAYASDLWAERMLWGVTVRSPHPSARIRSIQVDRARSFPGVRAVLTHRDVPGRKTFGLGRPDQPVLAANVVRYVGEPVVLVAAEDLEQARRAARAVRVDYEPLPGLFDPGGALTEGAVQVHPDGNLIRHFKIRKGRDFSAPIVIKGSFEVGMQDQAALGPEAGLAVPLDDGSLQIFVATQWLHEDLAQISASLGLRPDKLHLVLAGLGGAFGAREDVSVQIHCALLALATNRPVKMMYGRDESFVGHVHRHPARLQYVHGADRDGKLLFVKARVLLDGGAYTSTSMKVCVNAGSFAAGPYEVPNVAVDCRAVRSNNPPAGAMRGFGATQACFGHETQMDRLARELGLEPLEIRRRNAFTEHSVTPTGQRLRGPIAVREIIEELQAMPPPPPLADQPALHELPGGASNATHGEEVKRGVGYALGWKAFCYSEGFDDYSTARVRLTVNDGRPFLEVHSAAAEMGQGVAVVQVQIARSEIPVDDVVLLPADSSVGSAGSSSASRQTYMTAGAVTAACRTLRERLIALASEIVSLPPHGVAAGGEGLIDAVSGDVVIRYEDLLKGDAIEETSVFRHPETEPLDPETGQGRAFVSFMFVGHRAVVDVDRELGLVRVVELATAQDVGRAVNPAAVEGQMEGGAAQGMGLAIMEELRIEEGRILNASFTDYLIPTIVDMPPVRTKILEFEDPDGPFGVKGAGEPPAISSGPAVVAALTDALGIEIKKVPVRPDDLIELSG